MCWVLPLALQSLRKVRQLVAMLLPNLLHQRVVCVKKQQPPGGAVTAPEAEAAAPQKSSGKAAAKTKGRGKGRGKNKGPAAEPASASQPAAPAEPNQRDGPAEPAGKKRRIIVPSGVELGCSKCYHNTEVGCTTCRPKAGLVKISAQEWGWPPAAAAAAD